MSLRSSMKKVSAGLLVYRRRERGIEFLLVHPGGPFWAKKDLGAWTVPKGELEDGEDALEAAQREFREETGFTIQGPYEPLGEVRQAGGKTVRAWAAPGDFDPAHLKSNMFELEWPPKSGKVRRFPEVDAAEWFPANQALEKINPAQTEFVTRVVKKLAGSDKLPGSEKLAGNQKPAGSDG